MTDPGVASRVVKLIMAEHPTYAVVKVDITASSVVMNFLTPQRSIRAYAWQGNSVVPVDSDVADIAQATFDPREFNIADVGALFAAAVKLGASSSQPELQIVEYNPGEVLMTVTTRPESATVFFRKDGSPITQPDYATAVGLEEGLRDAVNGRTKIYAVGIQPGGTAVWVDAPGSAEGTIDRRTRQPKLPAYTSVRSESMQWPTFDPAAIEPAQITQRIATIRATWRLSLDEPITVTIDGHLQRSAPTITYAFNGQTVVTDLLGTDITAWAR